MKKKFLDRFKRPIFLIEDHCPIIGSLLIRILRDIRYSFYRIVFTINKNRARNIDIFKIYWVDPTTIQYCYNNPFNIVTDRGKIKDGSWDILSHKFSDTDTYQGLKERFAENKQWKDTKFYHKIVNRIKKGEIMWRCKNIKEWEDRLKKIDLIYANIKKNGFYSSRDIASFVYQGKEDEHYKKIDMILVSIGRNGQLLFNDGAHRLSIAKILRIPKVPIMILTRHKKWMDFKNKVQLYARHSGGKLYQPAYHFDLENISSTYGAERFNLIKKNISVFEGTLLDIGANFGYFCHCFEKLGFNCHAVEINPQDVYFMRKLRSVNRDQFKIIQQSIFDYKKNNILDFDVVLALNIFHHFLKRKTTYQNLIKLLKRFRIKELYLETHNPHEEQMKKAYKNYSPEEFVEFIIENTCLNKSKLIDKLERGRLLYKLYK